MKKEIRIKSDEMNEVETVSIGVFVGVGSRNETKEINGISHFLEHLAFKGTTTRSARQIAEQFEGIGGRINAYTSKEKTVYYAKVLKEHSEFAVEFLADILQNSVFDEEEIEKERGVILQEIAMTNDTPDDIIFDYFQDVAYPSQSLGRSILGPEKNIKKFTRDHFKNYIQEKYNSSNIVIASAGNLKQKDLEKYAKKYFHKLENKKIQSLEPAIYKGGDYRKEKKLEQVNLVLGFDGFSYLSKEYYTAQMLAMILGGGMSSRLFQEVRENKGLAYSIYAFNYSFFDSGVFGMYAATAPNKVNELLSCSCDELLKVCEKISEKEITRVRTQFQASLKMAKESTNSRLQRLGSDIISHSRIISDKEILDEVLSIKKTDITKLATKIFSSSTPTFACIGEVKKIMNHDKIKNIFL
jgi:predicted Zn-dependent peptidase